MYYNEVKRVGTVRMELPVVTDFRPNPVSTSCSTYDRQFMTSKSLNTTVKKNSHFNQTTLISLCDAINKYWISINMVQWLLYGCTSQSKNWL